MTLSRLYDEELVEAGENRIRLCLNFRAIDVIEDLTEMTMPEILPVLLGQNPPYALSGKVLYGLMREHHPETTLDEVAGLMLDKDHSPKVGMAMATLLLRVFNLGDGQEAKDRNPSAPHGASASS